MECPIIICSLAFAISKHPINKLILSCIFHQPYSICSTPVLVYNIFFQTANTQFLHPHPGGVLHILRNLEQEILNVHCMHKEPTISWNVWMDNRLGSNLVLLRHSVIIFSFLVLDFLKPLTSAFHLLKCATGLSSSLEPCSLTKFDMDISRQLTFFSHPMKRSYLSSSYQFLAVDGFTTIFSTMSCCNCENSQTRVYIARSSSSDARV